MQEKRLREDIQKGIEESMREMGKWGVDLGLQAAQQITAGTSLFVEAKIFALGEPCTLNLLLKQAPLDVLMVGDRQVDREAALAKDEVGILGPPLVVPTRAFKCLDVLSSARKRKVTLAHA